MNTEPKIESRTEQPYVAIRTQVPFPELPTVIPQLIDEVAAWLGQQGVRGSGAPFIRYHVINMAERLDIEVGWPLKEALQGNGRVAAGVLPAGQYATLVHIGPYEGLYDANTALIGWAKTQGIQWDSWDTAIGEAFASRYESYWTDPAEEPDPAKWETEVAIRVKS